MVYFLLSAFLVVAAAPGWVSAQAVELDRILSHVNNHLVTAADVRQARQLHLVNDVGSDAGAQHDLEDRWLILGEMDHRDPMPPPSAQAMNDRRAAKAAELGGASAMPKLLADAGMSDQSYEAWLSDDLKIEAFLQQQFGSTAEADRPKARADWLSRLRARAGLK
jgi:hypothetical protein